MNIVSSLACCGNCLGFIKDTIGDGKGIGGCKAYNHYLDKSATMADLSELVVRLGNKANYHVFWGGNEPRECSKFKTVD